MLWASQERNKNTTENSFAKQKIKGYENETFLLRCYQL
jgi:hypothetical protein